MADMLFLGLDHRLGLGFYPAYYECTVLTRTLSLVDEDDWYLHLPERNFVEWCCILYLPEIVIRKRSDFFI